MSVPYPPTRTSAAPRPSIFGSSETRDFRTESRARYSHPGQVRTQPFTPPVTLIQSGAFEGVPTYKADYSGQPAPPAVQYRPPVSEPGGVDSRDFATESKQAFDYKGYQVRPSLRPMEMPRVSLPFEATTVYRSEFAARQARPASSILPVSRPTVSREDRDFRPESAKFDFKGYQVRESLKPPETVIVTGPFQGVSTYKAEFVHQKIPHVRPDIVEKVPVFGMESFPQSTFGQSATQAALARSYNASDQFYSVQRHQQAYFTPDQRSQRLESPRAAQTTLPAVAPQRANQAAPAQSQEPVPVAVP